MVYMKRDIFTPKWTKSHKKKSTGFESDTLEMIRFACFVISIQQFPSFATKSILLAKSTYKIIMIKNYHILDTKNYTYVLNFIKMSFGID